VITEGEQVRGKTLLPVFALFFTVFSLSAVRAERKKEPSRSYYLPSKTEELEGTWKIENDPRAESEQKLVYYWWGYFETFRFANDKTPFTRGTSTIVDKWVDDEGALWYREFCRTDWTSRTIFFRLIRLSEDARKWESVQSTIDFPSPEDLSSDDRREKGYRVFYRHELEACCH
jgi:hypothetical protein